MSEQTNLPIRTNMDMIGEIHKFQMIQELNAHGMCILEGLVADGHKDEFVKDNIGGKEILIDIKDRADSGKTAVHFAGVMDEIAVFELGGLYTFRCKVLSHTCRMDLKKRRRSFQDKQMSYESLLRQIMQEYEGGDVLDALSGGKEIGGLLVQYEETDWEFLIRLASRLNGSLLPACEFGAPKIFFGAQKTGNRKEPEIHSYSMEKQLFCSKRMAGNGYPEFLESDGLQIMLECRDYYEAGSSLSYRSLPLFISRLEAELVSGEILYRYVLRTGKAMGQLRKYPEKLTGVSLPATVLKAVKDKIKVKFEMDGAQDEDRAWEFPYQTMYTAGGNGGWYCMPEPGDEVMIYFPGKEESEAVGTNSVRNPDTEHGEACSPEIKYFRTIHGKEIRFTPDAVEILCASRVDEETGGQKQIRIRLHQEDGIEIVSSEGITLTSGKGIRLEAAETIELEAKDRIRLHCKKGRIQMDSKIDIAGPDVRIN